MVKSRSLIKFAPKQTNMAFDIAIIGGGIVGAATFYKLQTRYPDKSIVLIEKEGKLADHQTGNNSDTRA